jgi:hypothetical protein
MYINPPRPKDASYLHVSETHLHKHQTHTPHAYRSFVQVYCNALIGEPSLSEGNFFFFFTFIFLLCAVLSGVHTIA